MKGWAGLCVIGTERHKANRIDNQLREHVQVMSESEFYLSLEDDLMKAFGSCEGFWTSQLMSEEAIEYRMLKRVSLKWQKRVEEK